MQTNRFRKQTASSRAIHWLGAVSACFLLGHLSAYGQAGALPAEERINGKLVWEAFEPQRQILQQSSAVIYTDEKSRIKTIYGVVVSAQGHILTKASEIEGKEHLSLRIGRQLYSEVEVIGTDPEWDVAMLKVKVEPDGALIPVRLSAAEDVEQGHWMISNGSTTRGKRRVRVGIVSATTRAIRSETDKVVLGVILALEKEGVLAIEKVTPDSGAAKAGIKPGDVLLSADGVATKAHSDLLELMKDKKAGDKLSVVILRGKKKLTLEVELMKVKLQPQQMSRNDQMSGGENSLSKRRSGFPRVIHHDTPLTKSSVGGPLLSLEGECVGMNIARASRVASFAIPAKELREIIARLSK